MREAPPSPRHLLSVRRGCPSGRAPTRTAPRSRAGDAGRYADRPPLEPVGLGQANSRVGPRANKGRVRIEMDAQVGVERQAAAVRIAAS
jgi:hypothetical protein